jgi:hypothetical protein
VVAAYIAAHTAPGVSVHALNEFYRLRNFDRGLRAYCALWEELARSPE